MGSFQDYNLKSFLGSGSFGVVWEVSNDDDDEREYALKVFLVDSENEEKQQRELDISLELAHENLVKVYGISRREADSSELKSLLHDDNCYSLISAMFRKERLDIFCMALELCGENLRSWLQEGNDPSLLRTILRQQAIVRNLLKGLEYLHSKRIIHRDLKPENIMFSKKGYILPVKIGDYGTCREIKETQTSTLTSRVGTELYRSPEAFSNDYSFQSDLFSLGLIMWEVLQLIPFKKLRGHFDKLVNDKKEGLVKFETSNEKWRTAVIHLCQKEVEKRPQNIGQLQIANLSIAEYTASTSEELREILQMCADGCSISLLDKVYEGPFQIRRKDITLKGLGKKTTITHSNTSSTKILQVDGSGFTASDFQVDGKYALDRLPQILIEGNNCLLENIVIRNWNMETGIKINSEAKNTKIHHVEFFKPRFPVNDQEEEFNPHEYLYLHVRTRHRSLRGYRAFNPESPHKKSCDRWDFY